MAKLIDFETMSMNPAKKKVGVQTDTDFNFMKPFSGLKEGQLKK
jgi:hypothetical protein